jgi:hypothetical protein
MTNLRNSVYITSAFASGKDKFLGTFIMATADLKDSGKVSSLINIDCIQSTKQSLEPEHKTVSCSDIWLLVTPVKMVTSSTAESRLSTCRLTAKLLDPLSY